MSKYLLECVNGHVFRQDKEHRDQEVTECEECGELVGFYDSSFSMSVLVSDLKNLNGFESDVKPISKVKKRLK